MLFFDEFFSPYLPSVYSSLSPCLSFLLFDFLTPPLFHLSVFKFAVFIIRSSS